MLLAAADAGTDRVQLQPQFLGDLLVFQFFDHVLDHHLLVKGREFLDEGHEPLVVLAVDDLLLRRDLRQRVAARRGVLAGLELDALLLLVLALDAGEVVQGGAGGDGGEPRAQLALRVEVRQVRERLLEALRHDVIDTRLRMAFSCSW